MGTLSISCGVEVEIASPLEHALNRTAWWRVINVLLQTFSGRVQTRKRQDYPTVCDNDDFSLQHNYRILWLFSLTLSAP